MSKLIFTAALGAALFTATAKEALVFVSAHPDDSDGFAATAMLLKPMYDIHVVDVTHGNYKLGEEGVDRNDPRIPSRMREELDACAYAGFTAHFLEEPDANACASDKSADQLAEIFRKLKPRAVFTHWPLDRHADHVQCSALVARALVRSGLAPAPGQAMPPNAAERYFFEEWLQQTKNFHYIYSVDVSATISNKVEMLRKYTCQDPENSLVKPTLHRLALRGNSRTPKCSYAEIFTPYDGVPVPGGVLEQLKETAILGSCAGRNFSVTGRELWRDNEKVGRSGHMGHALVDCGNGRILDFTSNCDGKSRCNGHSGHGWMEYQVSTDYGKTFGPPRILPYSKKAYDEGKFTALCEKAVRAPDGKICLFFQITDPTNPICCEPWDCPTMITSSDGGETFSEPVVVCPDNGRIYDAVVDSKNVYFLIQANPHFLGTGPEHKYKVYKGGSDGKFTPSVLPIDAKGRGYGALEFAPDGALYAYTYNSNQENELDYTISRDGGVTWSKPGKSHVEKLIRNPQIRRIDNTWFLIGRNGGGGDGLAFYTSPDGINWDDGWKLDERPKGQGTGYYSCLLPILEPGQYPKMLMQYSHPYSGSCVNIIHRWITLSK